MSQWFSQSGIGIITSDTDHSSHGEGLHLPRHGRNHSMKINEIIRKKRTEKGYTQEQMASFLGVSAPAVNKWEKAISYPDITLLPALARLLDTDLNTLLSFQEDLTREEVGTFMNVLVSVAETKGIDGAFQIALEKCREYPSCDFLLLNAALTLEGLLLTSQGSAEETHWLDIVEDLYVRASRSCDPEIGNQAKAMLISKHIGRKEFDTAEKLLEELPAADLFNKKQLTAMFYLEQDEWEKAAELIEQKVLSEISDILSSVYTLVEIAVKENQISAASQMTAIARQITELFGLWEGNIHIAELLLATAQKDADGCLNILEKMLPSLNKDWKPGYHPLYRHLSLKDTNIGQMIRCGIVNELTNPENHAYDFLRNHPDLKKLLSRYC